MEKILFIGGGTKNGPGHDIFEKLKREFNCQKIGRKILYSREYIEVVNTFKPNHIILSTYVKCRKEIRNLMYSDVTESIASKIQPLLKVSQNLNNEASSVLIFGGFLSNVIELDSLPTSLASVCAEKMVEYLSVFFQGQVRFNCINPSRMLTEEKQAKESKFVSTEDVFLAVKMILQNNAINGTSIIVDRGYSVNYKKGNISE